MTNFSQRELFVLGEALDGHYRAAILASSNDRIVGPVPDAIERQALMIKVRNLYAAGLAENPLDAITLPEGKTVDTDLVVGRKVRVVEPAHQLDGKTVTLERIEYRLLEGSDRHHEKVMATIADLSIELNGEPRVFDIRTWVIAGIHEVREVPPYALKSVG